MRPTSLLLLSLLSIAASGERLLVDEWKNGFKFSLKIFKKPGSIERVLEGPGLSLDLGSAAVVTLRTIDGFNVTFQSREQVPEGQPTQIVVEKTADDLCITVGDGKESCEHASIWHRMAPGYHEVSLKSTDRLAVHSFVDMGNMALLDTEEEEDSSAPRRLFFGGARRRRTGPTVQSTNKDVTLNQDGTYKYSFEFLIEDASKNYDLFKSIKMEVEYKSAGTILAWGRGSALLAPWSKATLTAPPANTLTTITVEKSECKFCAFLNSDAPVCVNSKAELPGSRHVAQLRKLVGSWDTKNFQSFAGGPVTGEVCTHDEAGEPVDDDGDDGNGGASAPPQPPLPAVFGSPEEALAFMGQVESGIVGHLFKNPGEPVTISYPGATLTAFALTTDGNSSGNSSTASMTGEGGAAVDLPLDALAQYGNETACSMGIYDEDFLSKLTGETSNETTTMASAAMSVTLFNKDGTALNVSDLSEPIKVVLPTNRTAGQVCAYWDPEQKQWRTDGVENVGEEGGPMECRVTHLTLFASIIQGFLNALLCSQLSLLSAESIQGLSEGDWWKAPMSIIFWVLVTFLTSLFILAFILDKVRGNVLSSVNRNELFLIPLDRIGTIASDDAADEEAAPPGRCAPVTNCMSSACSCCQEGGGGALRDAMDDVISRWFEFFGEVRTFVESIATAVMGQDMKEGDGGSRCTRILEAITRALVLGAARRRASASLGLTDEDVTFIMYDKDLDKLLDAALPFLHKENSQLTPWEIRLKEWGWLHRATMKHFRVHWKSTGWRAMPSSFCQLFFVSNPFVTVFLGGNIWSCSTRVLLLTCELLGAIVVATFFYEASGGVQSKKSRCESEPANIWEELGRIIAIGVVSLLVAGLPISILGSLHSRSFKKFNTEGSPEWKKQLKIWRIQDVLLWVIGLAYLAFCVFFIMLFLANVAPEDHTDWGLSGGISLMEDTVAIPLGVAIVIPLLAASILAITSCVVGKSRKALLEDGRASIMNSGVNVERVLSI